jgi:hypothetical protein
MQLRNCRFCFWPRQDTPKFFGSIAALWNSRRQQLCHLRLPPAAIAGSRNVLIGSMMTHSLGLSFTSQPHQCFGWCSSFEKTFDIRKTSVMQEIVTFCPNHSLAFYHMARATEVTKNGGKTSFRKREA